jgi:hypothetical protein
MGTERRLNFSSESHDLLQGFPQLQSLQIIAYDDVGRQLGGWLQTGDPKLLDLFSPYNPSYLEVDEVIAAFGGSRVALPTLRLYSAGKISPGILLHHSLTTLRITNRSGWRDDWENSQGQVCLPDLISSMPTLADFAFVSYKGEGGYYEDGDDFLTTFEEHKKLRSFRLFEYWNVRESCFEAFVKPHCNTLRSLVYEDCHLVGDWRSLLKAVAPACKGKLEFLRVAHPVAESLWDGELRDADITITDLADFTCVVELRPFEYTPSS